MAKKFFITKNEIVASVIDKIVSAQQPEIIVVVPRSSALRESVENFELIARESEAAGKVVTIESVDEEVLAFAKASGLHARHPLFKGDDHRLLTDIVSRDDEVEPSLRKDRKRRRVGDDEDEGATPRLHVRTAHKEVEKPVGDEREIQEVHHAEETFFSHAPPREEVGDVFEETPTRRKKGRRWVFIVAGVTMLLGATAWVIGAYGSEAVIALNFKKTPWTLEGTVTVRTSARDVDFESAVLPGQVFTDERTIVQTFGASGFDEVSQKAKGVMTIYNGYSSDPQVLVATTRFVSSDGKVYRLIDRVTVPGADVRDGKITAATLDAAVVADQAGPEYNREVTQDHFSIPGFQGTPRYEGFYGVLKEPTRGGFIGRKPVPTESDIAAAETRVPELLQTSLTDNLLKSQPDEYVQLDEATEVEIIRVAVNKDTDDDGNFSVFGEGKVRTLVFLRKDLERYLEYEMTKSHPDSVLQDIEVSYRTVAPDFLDGELVLAFTVQSVVRRAFSEDALIGDVLGMRVREAQRRIEEVPGLDSGRLSIWPVWLTRIPDERDRIRVTMQ